jgi:hypothetical protein
MNLPAQQVRKAVRVRKPSALVQVHLPTAMVPFTYVKLGGRNVSRKTGELLPTIDDVAKSRWRNRDSHGIVEVVSSTAEKVVWTPLHGHGLNYFSSYEIFHRLHKRIQGNEQ